MKYSLRNLNISSKVYLGYALVLSILISAVIVSYTYSNKIINSSKLISHTHEVLTTLADVEGLLIDLETGQRGYIITGKKEYLEPYKHSLTHLDDKLSELYTLTADNVSQSIRIESLKKMVTRKIEELEETILLRKSEGFESAKKIVVSDLGKRIMDSIRVQIQQIENEEKELLDLRSTGPTEAKNTNNNILILLVVICSILAISIGYYTSNSISDPINILIKSTEIIGKGNWSHQVRINTKEEIGKLSRAFEKMLSQLKSTTASKDILAEEVAIRKKTEIELNKARVILEQYTLSLEQKNKESEEFVYIASHDLQEPLRTIKGFIGLIEDESNDELNENSKQYLDYISQSSNRMSELIKGLLDYGRIGQNKKSSMVDCNKHITSILDDLSSIITESGTKFEIGELPKLKAYDTELRMLFQNLITNAIKYQKKGVQPFIKISAKKNSGNWEFSISDNGIGIAKKHVNRIFQIFQRLHNKDEYSGTGIGLAHCRKIAEMHGGKIWVDSQLNTGSTFHFTIST